MDKSFRSSRKRVLPVDSTPHNSQTNSQEKKKTTPKFVPPLKKALTSANQCLTHHPAAVLASQELPSSQGSSIHLPADSQGSSIDLSAGSQGSSIELSFNDRQTADSIDKAASPAACPPPKRSFRAAAQRSRHTYTLTKSHVGQLDKRAVLQSSMAAAPSLGVFDFPISQNHQAANTSSRADITCDADQSTGNLFRLNASMTGRSLEQQVHTPLRCSIIGLRHCRLLPILRCL